MTSQTVVTDAVTEDSGRSAVIVSGELNNIGDLLLMVQTAMGLKRHLGIGRVFARQWGAPNDDVLREIRKHGVEPVTANRKISALFAKDADYIVIGGGQMVRDNTSLRSLLNLLVNVLYCRTRGKGIALVGCGMSALMSPTHKFIWRTILSSATFVGVRDEASAQSARQLRAGATAAAPRVFADLALMSTPITDTIRPVESPSAGKTLVVAPCFDESEQREFSLEALAGKIAAVKARLAIDEVVLIAHDVREAADPVACTAIAERLRTIGIDCKLRIFASHQLEQYLVEYERADFVFTNRLHAMLIGILAEKPVFIIEDGSPKLGPIAARFAVPRLDLGLHDEDVVAEVCRYLASFGKALDERRGVLAHERLLASEAFVLMSRAFNIDKRLGKPAPAYSVAM